MARMPLSKLFRICGVTVVLAAAGATVAAMPAAADQYQVVVRLADGTTATVVLDLAPGTTLDQVVGNPALPEGTPIALEPLASDPPPTTVAQDPAPAPDPAPADPAPEQQPSTDTAPPPPPADQPPAGGDPPADPTPPATDDPGTPPADTPPAEQPPPGLNSGQSAPPPPEPPSNQPDDIAEPPAQGVPDDAAPDTGTPAEAELRVQRRPGTDNRLRNPDGTPTQSNPGFMDVLPGPSSATGVPNFIIRKFRVPPFLLPIYQAAGVEYGVRWEVLAAINEIETDYGRNLNVSSAGAVGWMQFLPSSWRRYGVDANQDGRKDPYNPVDAIFAAAHYLHVAGYSENPRRAIFAYNHADWYVDSVMLRARLLAAVPADLIGSLTGLTEGRFPVRARATYADDIAERELLKRVGRGQNAANLVESSAKRRSIDIFADSGSPVVAVNDGVVKRVGSRAGHGYRLVLQDVYGNRYKYAHLDKVSRRLHAGKSVRGGAVVGRIGATVADSAPHLRFGIRPSGRGAPTIDPKPILDGWQLLAATEIYRANGKNVLREGPSVGQILLLSKPLLQKRVLADGHIDIYPCGREDIAAGRIDRRVLATLEYLAESGLSPTVSALRCGHSYHTKSGNVSEHSSGNAVDISKVNGMPILGHQEPGGIADQTVRRLMLLQGTMVPHQVISLLSIGGPTMAMADHADHVHVGFRPAGEAWSRAGYSVLKPSQWPALMSRLNSLSNPIVP
jgi:Peptidase family M23/Transglycosylase SLT domain